MKTIFASAMVMVVAACTQKYHVHTIADRDHDIRLLGTYHWSPVDNIERNRNPLYYNEMNDKFIKAAVDRNLVNRNYKVADDGGELILHYHIIERNVSISREDPYFYHQAPWMGSEKSYYDYSEGTLIIDIMDRKNRTLLWRGLATGIFNSERPYLSQEIISEAIDEIFADFPAASL